MVYAECTRRITIAIGEVLSRGIFCAFIYSYVLDDFFLSAFLK
jgi:hypothetical protein